MSNLATSHSQWFSVEVIDDVDFNSLSDFLSGVSYLYPNFNAWLNFTFRRNLPSGQRKIILAHDQMKIIGVSLLKNTVDEKKICTFYVSPEFRGLGVGRKLLDMSLALLNSNDSFITVSSERKNEIEHTLKSRGFKVSESITGLYRDESTEFTYTL